MCQSLHLPPSIYNTPLGYSSPIQKKDVLCNPQGIIEMTRDFLRLRHSVISTLPLLE